MRQTFNPKAPANAGVTFTGLPGLVVDQEIPGNLTGPMVGKAAQDQDKRWTQALLPANAVQNGSLVAGTMVLVNSQGHATPAQITGVIGWTTNGNLRVSIKRQPLPDTVKAVRQQAQQAQKEQYKAHGPQVRQQAAQPLPSLPGEAPQAPQVTPAPQAQAQAPDLVAMLAGMTQEQAVALLTQMTQGSQAQAQAPATPALPTVPKAPRGKAPKAQ